MVALQETCMSQMKQDSGTANCGNAIAGFEVVWCVTRVTSDAVLPQTRRSRTLKRW